MRRLAGVLAVIVLVPLASALADNIPGTDGDDELRGTDAADVIRGFAGDDELDGRGGFDVLRGGLGQDTVLGHAGNDRLVDDPESDVTTSDAAFGHGGDDVAVGYGFGSQDILNLGRGDDVVRLGGDAQYTVVTCEQGDDRLVWTGSLAPRTIRNCEHLVGVGAAAHLPPTPLLLDPTHRGTRHRDTIRTGAADDRVVLRGGNDAALTRRGDDWVSGGRGADHITTGRGADTVLEFAPGLTVRGFYDNVIVTGRGADRVYVGDHQLVVTGDGNDRIVVVHGSRDYVACGDGFDVLTYSGAPPHIIEDCERVRRP